jgi:hypothetical protein
MPTSLRDIIATSHYRQRLQERRRNCVPAIIQRVNIFAALKDGVSTLNGNEGSASTFVFNDDGTFDIDADPRRAASEEDGAAL